jgi:hypothetical protein
MNCAEKSNLQKFSMIQERDGLGPKTRPKVPEINAPGQGGQILEAPKIEVIREPTPDRKSSLNPGV